MVCVCMCAHNHAHALVHACTHTHTCECIQRAGANREGLLMPCFRRPLEVEMSFLGLLTSPFSQSQQTPPPLQRNADTLPNPPTSPPSPVVSTWDEFPIKTEETETGPSYFICLSVVCWKRFSFSVLKRQIGKAHLWYYNMMSMPSSIFVVNL